MTTENWYTSNLDGEIEYKAIRVNNNGIDSPQTIDRVMFERINVEAGCVRELVSVHWSEAFKWADYDPCGGLGVRFVKMTDGTEVFASGRYFRDGGLSEIIVGCYGTCWMRRKEKVKRDEHGYPVRKDAQ